MSMHFLEHAVGRMRGTTAHGRTVCTDTFKNQHGLLNVHIKFNSFN